MSIERISGTSLSRAATFTPASTAEAGVRVSDFDALLIADLGGTKAAIAERANGLGDDAFDDDEACASAPKERSWSDERCSGEALVATPIAIPPTPPRATPLSPTPEGQPSNAASAATPPLTPINGTGEGAIPPVAASAIPQESATAADAPVAGFSSTRMAIPPRADATTSAHESTVHPVQAATSTPGPPAAPPSGSSAPEGTPLDTAAMQPAPTAVANSLASERAGHPSAAGTEKARGSAIAPTVNFTAAPMSSSSPNSTANGPVDSISTATPSLVPAASGAAGSSVATGDEGASDSAAEHWRDGQAGKGVVFGRAEGPTASSAVREAGLSAGARALPPLARQVAPHIARAAKNGLEQIHISLEPEWLGKVDVRLDLGKDSALGVTILADNASALEALRGDARALQQSLADAGFSTDVGGLNFGLSDRGGGGPPRGSAGSAEASRDPEARSQSPDGAMEVGTTPAPPARGPTDRLDIHA